MNKKRIRVRKGELVPDKDGQGGLRKQGRGELRKM